MQEIGLYIHVPFCKSKCFYCDFKSFDNKNHLVSSYFSALNNEISLKKSMALESEITTIYIGGGTPSFVDEKYLEKILLNIRKNYNVSNNAEITIEINPSSSDFNKFIFYKNMGINRASIGLQSDNDKILKTIGRPHSYLDFLNTYENIKKSGIFNINVDLIMSLPFQTLKIFEKTLNGLIKLNPNHISAYSLIIEKNTPLFDFLRDNNLEIDDDLDREMYHMLRRKLKENDYIQYEISNFSKKGFESKHNQNCWDYKEYLGFGSNAHSFINNERIENEDIEKYISLLTENKLAIKNKEKLSNEENLKTYIMLKLRTINGINLDEINKKFKIDFLKQFKDQVSELKELNLIDYKNKNLYATDKGLDFLNFIINKFI